MKKLISMLMTVVMVLALVPSAFAAEGASVDKFTDVPADAWYRDELAYALHNGYISGTSETTFAPDALVTRGQFVTILGRMVNADVSQFKTTQFEDVDITSWYGPYVEWARSTGIVNGISSKEFAPTNNITVEQMSVMVSNCISKLSLSPKAAPVVYSDMSSVSTWAVSGVEAMAKYNLIPVDAASNINPHKQATRSECTVSLVRLAQSTGIGVAPSASSSSSDSGIDVVEKVKSIHDELWTSGQIKSSMTEKEKAIAYMRWVCENCSYKTGEDAVNVFGQPKWVVDCAYGPLIVGIGDCDGLAHAYKELLDYEGIPCKFAAEWKPGHLQGHAWNVLTLDGVDYKIDPTAFVCTTKNGDGSLDNISFEVSVLREFYPDEYEASRPPLQTVPSE